MEHIVNHTTPSLAVPAGVAGDPAPAPGLSLFQPDAAGVAVAVEGSFILFVSVPQSEW